MGDHGLVARRVHGGVEFGLRLTQGGLGFEQFPGAADVFGVQVRLPLVGDSRRAAGGVARQQRAPVGAHLKPI